MASKIQSRIFYVPITPYKITGIEDEFNELSVMSDYDDMRKYFYVGLHAGWSTRYGHGCIIYGPDRLQAPSYVHVKSAPRNSQKTINEMSDALELAKDDIAWLFDQRNWVELDLLVKNVALYGYTPEIEQRMKDMKNAQDNETTNNNSNPQNNQEMEKTTAAQDYVGKTITVGDGIATIEIKSAQDDVLQGEFKTGNAPATIHSFKLADVQKMIDDGVWHLGEGKAKAEEPKAEPKPEIKLKRKIKLKTKVKADETKTEEPEPEQESEPEPETSEPEPETEPKQEPKPKKESIGVETGTPRIIEKGKGIIVTGDASRIEPVLKTMWGKKCPYTHKGKTYQGIVLSAKRKETVREIIKLAYAC